MVIFAKNVEKRGQHRSLTCMFHVKATKSLGTSLLYFLSCFMTDKTQLVGNPSIGNDPSGLPYFEQKEEKKKKSKPLVKGGDADSIQDI